MRYEFDKVNNTLTLFLSSRYHNQPLSLFFDDYKISKKDKYLYLQENRIVFDGKVIKKDSVILLQNKLLTIHLKSYEVDWSPSVNPANIIYQNDFIAIVHKDPHMIIHSDKDDPNCLNGMVAKYFIENNIHTTIRPIHRLDEETTGLLLYVKIPFLQPWFDEQIASKRITRHYLAITQGKTFDIGKKFGINAKISRDRHHNGVYRVSQTGKPSFTHVEILKVLDGFSLVGCTLETGRTHQIRVHLSHMGMPIVNDVIYGHPSKSFTNMCLWADSITFFDPFTNKKHTIKDRPTNPDYNFFNNIQ